jgi:hypothetical protein
MTLIHNYFSPHLSREVSNSQLKIETFLKRDLNFFSFA